MTITQRLTESPQFYKGDYPPVNPLDDLQEALVRDFNKAVDAGELPVESRPCLCGNEKFLQIAEFDRYRIRQPTVICESCGLIQSMPRLTRESSARFYGSDLYRALYDPDLLQIEAAMFDDMVARTRHRHAYIAARLGDAVESVLEIGCAAGWNLYPFYRDGRAVTGFDQGPHLVAFGRGQGMDLKVGSIEDAVAEGRRYDLIILSHVLEHFLDPVDELERLAACLAEDGAFYIEVPNAEAFCLGLLQNAHTYYFTPATLNHYAGRAGLAADSIDDARGHMAGVFRRTGDRSSLARLDGELETMRRRIRAYERRESTKDALRRLGFLSLARSAVAIARKR